MTHDAGDERECFGQATVRYTEREQIHKHVAQRSRQAVQLCAIVGQQPQRADDKRRILFGCMAPKDLGGGRSAGD